MDEMVTRVVALTGLVVIVNAGEVRAPPATVTEIGTLAAELLLLSVTMAPPAGAAAFKVTVADVELPPTTDVCVNVMAAP